MASLTSPLRLLAGSLLLGSVLAGVVPLESRKTSTKKYYQGFDRIKYMFIFGDSYTTTGFNATTGPQPSPSNPLGNPTYPGYTAADGPNWVDYLTVQYNESLIQTYNLAYGGATVDSSLVAQYLPTVLDVQQQVDDEFIPIYGNKVSAKANGAHWGASDSLFGIFIGINDVGNSWYEGNSTLNSLIFAEYSKLVEELYDHGAKNFFFLNVPPVNLAPLTTAEGSYSITTEGDDITTFNELILSMAVNLTHLHADTTVFVFDTHTLFLQVLSNPSQFPETALYKNTTGYCVAYENGTPTPTTFYPDNCTYPVDEYFWLNSLHPTWPMHELLAKEVADMLEGGDDYVLLDG